MTATSEAQPGTRSGGIAPAQTLTDQPKGSRPKGHGATKISLTDRIVSTAARWIYEGRRLDMQGLADELGVSRVTLFRRVGGREELISQALWRLTERMLEIAVERWEAERPDGELHTPGTIRHINAMVAGSAGLRRLLDQDYPAGVGGLAAPAEATKAMTAEADPNGPSGAAARVIPPHPDLVVLRCRFE